MYPCSKISVRYIHNSKGQNVLRFYIHEPLSVSSITCKIGALFEQYDCTDFAHDFFKLLAEKICELHNALLILSFIQEIKAAYRPQIKQYFNAMRTFERIGNRNPLTKQFNEEVKSATKGRIQFDALIETDPKSGAILMPELEKALKARSNLKEKVLDINFIINSIVTSSLSARKRSFLISNILALVSCHKSDRHIANIISKAKCHK